MDDGTHEPGPLPADGTAATSWSSRNPAVGAVVLVALVVAALVGEPVGFAVVAAVAVAGALVGMRVGLRVDDEAVHVELGLGWPERHIPLDRIVAVRVEPDVRPLRHGGWGLRLTWGTQAHVIRRGAGIRIVRDRGWDVVVTLDDAEGAAAAIERRLDLRHRSGG